MSFADWTRTETSTAATPATPATDQDGNAGTVATVATVADSGKAQKNASPLPDPAMGARRQRVLTMLAENPGVRYAVLTDTQTDPEAVLLTLATRGRATCELRIPRAKYDGLLLLDLIERHGGTIH